MKYSKIFMALLTALLMVACSNDDDAINTQQVTAGFENSTMTVKENVGYFNVPIKIEGYRNGDIKINVAASPTGDNPAQEDMHYMITDKSLVLLNDTTESAVLNVQIKTVDDQEINENRTFNLEITSAEGVNITTKTVNITLRDNDAAFFEKFYGRWTMTAVDYDGLTVEKTITISGPTDEDDPDYDKILSVSAPAFFNVGVSLDLKWHFRYSFDTATKTGKLAFICGEEIASYGSAYSWVWATDDGQYYTYDDVATDWALGENGEFPTTIEWHPTDAWVYLYQPGAGFWDVIDHITMTKE